MKEQGYNVYDYFTAQDMETNLSQEPMSTTTEKPETPFSCVSIVSGFTWEQLVLSAFAGAVIMGLILWIISKIRDKPKSRTRAGSFHSISDEESTDSATPPLLAKEKKSKETPVSLCDTAKQTGDEKPSVVILYDAGNNTFRSAPMHPAIESDLKVKPASVHPVHSRPVTANPSGGQRSGVMQNPEFQATDTGNGNCIYMICIIINHFLSR